VVLYEYMNSSTRSRTVTYLGDVYRIDESPSGVKVFELKDGKEIPAPGSLIPTLDFEGVSVETPTI
jgi:hypothetical protein